MNEENESKTEEKEYSTHLIVHIDTKGKYFLRFEWCRWDDFIPLSRLGENAFKLSIIYCLSREHADKPRLEVQDIQWGIQRAQIYFEELTKLCSLRKQRTPVRVVKTNIERETRERWIRDQTEKNGQVTTSGFAEEFNISQDASLKFFNRLHDEGKLLKEVKGYNAITWGWKF